MQNAGDGAWRARACGRPYGGCGASSGLRQAGAIIRADLFGAERLEHHADSLAKAQVVTDRPRDLPSLTARLRDTSTALLSACRSCADPLLDGASIPAAAERLIDNFRLVRDQGRHIADDLPPGYHRQRPKLAGQITSAQSEARLPLR